MNNETVVLRQWRDADLASFAEMNADPEVMEFLPQRLTFQESEAFLGRIRNSIDQQGWGLWAVEVNGEVAGFTGLARPTFEAIFMPCVEIGWRLRRQFWGRGIGYLAARQAEHFAFAVLGLSELVSFTSTTNGRSRRLMERLGFQRNPGDDFLHPRLPRDHPLCPHVLYRKNAQSFARIDVGGPCPSWPDSAA